MPDLEYDHLVAPTKSADEETAERLIRHDCCCPNFWKPDCECGRWERIAELVGILGRLRDV